MLLRRFQQCLGSFTMLLFQGSFKRDFLQMSLNRSFAVLNLANAKPLRVIFISEMFKTSSRFQKCRKTLGINFLFLRYLRLNWLR